MASLSIDDEYTNDLPVANNSGFDQAYFLPAHAYKGNLQWAPRIRFHPTIMKPISKVIISTDGVKIYAEAIGDPSKPALVLIPGYSLSTIVFEKQFSDANLYKDVYLIRYDSRGHGRSDKPDSEDSYSSKIYSDDFVAVCKEFGLKRPVLAGWSLGAAIMTDVCANIGHDFISGVISMAGVPYLGDILTRLVTPSVLSLIPGLTSTDNVAAHNSAELAFADMLFYNPESIPYETRLAWMGSTILQPPHAASFVLTRKQDNEALLEAGRQGLSILIIHGYQDAMRLSSTGVVDELRPYFKAIEIVGLENAGHAFFYERWEETNSALLAFTKKVAKQ